MTLDRGQLIFGNGKSDEDRTPLVDRHEVHVIGFDDITLLNQDVSRTSVDWRVNRAVFQLQPGTLKRRSIGRDIRLSAFDRRAVRSDGLSCGSGLSNRL